MSVELDRSNENIATNSPNLLVLTTGFGNGTKQAVESYLQEKFSPNTDQPQKPYDEIELYKAVNIINHQRYTPNPNLEKVFLYQNQVSKISSQLLPIVNALSKLNPDHRPELVIFVDEDKLSTLVPILCEHIKAYQPSNETDTVTASFIAYNH